MLRCLRSLLGFSSILFLAGTSYAQVDRSGLNGTATDASGRLLPQTHITVVQNQTQMRRETVSRSNGSYSLSELPVGAYTITFEHDGFKSLTFLDVEQVIGRTRTLNATLSVSGGEQRVEVPASSEQMDTSTAAFGGRVEKAQVERLPLNGRNWATLTSLVPGAVDTGGSNQRSIRFAGRGRDDDNFTYDGIDATNVINQAQQPYVRLSIPLDTIEEFRIDTMLATAEGGGTGGPQLAATSPSGTNQFHGRIFEYLRNDALDAQQPFTVNGSKKPPLRLNQFGGSLGGPIVRKKTFFFVAYEGYRQHWGFPLAGLVPSSAFRSRALSESSVLSPVINAYPVGQTHTSNPDVDNFTSSGTQQVTENSAMIRLDHHFSEKTTSFARFNIDRAVNTQPLVGNSNLYLKDTQQLTSAPVNGGLELMHIFNPNLVNEIKFGFNRSTANTINQNFTGVPYAVAVSGFTTLNNNKVNIGAGNSFGEIDNLTWIKGRHTVKTGVEIRRIQMNKGNSEAGTISFASTEDFEANKVSSASLNGTLPINGLRKTQFFAYAQDEFRWTPNLTLNLGLRYSFFNIFNEVQGHANPFDFNTCGAQGYCGVGASFGQKNYGDFDPRVAFAWSPSRDSKTVLRGGFGIYHEDGQLDDQDLPISNEVFAYSLSNKTIPNLSYPIDPFLTNTPGIISPRATDRQRKDTYMEQWSLSLQRMLPGDFVATLSYVGSRGLHLLTLSSVNMVNPLTGTRPFPNFGQVSWRGAKASSSYEGFSAAVKRSFSRGLLLSANYMWSHEIDDGSNGSGDGDSVVAQNVACPACERASGIWDARHVLNANAVYELPFGPGKRFLNSRGAMGRILGSWEATSAVVARTGFPVNVMINRSAASVPDGNTSSQRPDLVPGASLVPTGGRSIAQWINPLAFATPKDGTFGNAPRDLDRGPGAWQMDLGVTKRFLLTEMAHLEFRSEFFNLFNHSQYGLPQATFGVPGFGSITQTVNTTTPVSPVGSGTPREIQFALRLQF